MTGEGSDGPLAAVFAAPGRYIQGRDAVARLEEVLEQLGSTEPLIVRDPIVEEIVGETLNGLSGATHVEFSGECSAGEIDRVAQEARSKPSMDGEQQQRYERARNRVRAIRGFYVHATIFVFVNLGLFLINWLSGGGWWFYWPLLGWSIGLAAHALGTFGFVGGPWGRDWEDRKIREMMDREGDG